MSVHGDEAYIMRALAAGARAYLLKNSTDEDLIPAIRAVAAGRPFFSLAVAGVLVEDYVRQMQQRRMSDSYDLLTDREKQVLHLLAEVRSNKAVATVLNLGLSTVDTHRANLMQKLNLHNTAQVVLYAVRKGLIISHRQSTSPKIRADINPRLDGRDISSRVYSSYGTVCGGRGENWDDQNASDDRDWRNG